MNKISTKSLTYAAILIAMNVVLTRIVAIPIGATLRITVGSVPIILASLWLGPVIGGICGGSGDFIGCLLSGYAPNPFIMISAILTGVLPYVFKRFLVKDLSIKGKKTQIFGIGFLKLLLILGFMSLITSLGFTTFGLSLLQGLPFGTLFITRLPQSIFLTIVNSVLVLLVYTSPVTFFVQNSIRELTAPTKHI